MTHDAPAAAPSAVRAGLLDRLATSAAAVAAASLVTLVAVQGWQVLARYALNDSPSWTEPATLLLLATTMSLAAAAGVHAQRHFAFTLLADAAAPGLRRVLRAASEAIVAAIGLALAVGGARLLLDGVDIRTAGAPWPQSLPFAPLALGGALMAVFALARLARLLRGSTAGGEG